jgi:hypothetical protein
LQMVHDLIKSKGLSLDGTQRSLCKWIIQIHEKDGVALCERLLFRLWLKKLRAF